MNTKRLLACLRRGHLLLVAAIIIARPLAAQKHPRPIPPGEYVTELGWGNLSIKSGKDGTLHFSIQTIGGNGHTCSLDGELHEGVAKLPGIEDDNPCVVTMVDTSDGINVKGAPYDACRTYCGARASFPALYLRPSAACTDKAIARTQDKFQQLYDTKQFAAARTTLEPLLQCKRTMNWMEEGRIRNDLAVTLHKLGDLAACRAVLEPLAKDANTTDEELKASYPPFDFETRLPLVRMTRTNLRLCKKKV